MAKAMIRRASTRQLLLHAVGEPSRYWYSDRRTRSRAFPNGARSTGSHPPITEVPVRRLTAIQERLRVPEWRQLLGNSLPCHIWRSLVGKRDYSMGILRQWLEIVYIGPLYV